MKKLLGNGKYGYLAKNTIIFTFSSFGSKILTFLLIPLYTNTLSTSDYGIADLVVTTTNLLVYVFTLEISSAVLRYAIERNTKQGEILSYGLKTVCIGSIVLFIATFVLNKLRLFPLPDYFFLFLLLNFLCNSFGGVLSNYLRAIDDVLGCAISGIITTVLMLSGNLLVLLVFKWGIIGYLISLVFSSFIGIVFMSFRVRISKTFCFKDRCDKTVGNEMRRFSIPLVFNGIGWWINNSLDKYFILWMINSASNGVYAAAIKIPTILSMFQQVFSQAWNLSAIKEFDKDDSSGFFTNTYNTYNAFLVMLTSGLIFFNIPLARILFAKDFFIAWECASILIISALFSSLSGFLGSVFTAVKKSKVFAYSTITAAIVNLVLNYVLIGWIGLQGAAVATGISFFIIWLIRLIFVKRIMSIKIKIWRDSLAYILLLLQVVCDHSENHGYLFQGIIILVIVLLYSQEMIAVVKKGMQLIKKLLCL